MKAKDHIQIGRILAKTYSLRCRHRSAFVLGNILPDINVFSYLTPYRKNYLRGHSYTFKRKKMERHMESPRTHSVCWWLRTGILCHYLTDSFTGAHDETRRMSLACHRAYEFRLHERFLQEQKKLQILPGRNLEALSGTVAEMRREYRRAGESIDTDCRMILDAVRGVIGTMAGEIR